MTRPSHPFLYLLLAAALFMRAFLPQGYMPERTESGAIAVAVCGSGGIHLIALGNGTGGEEDRQRIEPPCAFAGLGAAAVPPPVLFAIDAPSPVAPAFAERARPRAAAAPPHLRPPVRGPPLAA